MLEKRRVGVIGTSLISPAGVTPLEALNFIMDGHVSNIVQCNLPLVDVVTETRLVNMAVSAVARLYETRLGLRKIDYVCLGSTSSSFLQHEHNKESAITPDYVSRYLGHLLGIPDDNVLHTSQACASSSHAIALGADLIKLGYADVVLAGGVDELTQCVIDAFDAAKALSHTGCRPFDDGREGLVLGEAAAFVILAAPGIGDPLAYIDGIGLSCDANSPVAVTKEGVVKAINMALEDAEASDCEPTMVIAHGTGTVQGDQAEAIAIQESIDLPRVTSYKGNLGHPQGASGAVSVVLAVEAMKHGVYLPTAGRLLGYRGVKIAICQNPVENADVSSTLCLSSGSWGVNAALFLRRAHDYDDSND